MIARLFTHSRTVPSLSCGMELRRIRLCYTIFSCFLVSLLTLTEDPAWSTHLFIPILCLHLSHAVFLNSHHCCFIICNTYSFRVGAVCLMQLQSTVLRSLPVDTLCVM